QHDHAWKLFKDSLRLCRETGVRRVMEACFRQIAEIAATQGDALRAARLFGAAAALREELGVAMPETDKEGYERSVTIARQQLDDMAFNDAWTEGQSMSLDIVISYALEEMRI